MAQNKAGVFSIGPATISLGGADLGHMEADGITAKLDPSVKHAFVAKYGTKVPVASLVESMGLKITVKFSQTDDFAALQKMFPGVTKVTNGADNKLTWGVTSGTLITPALLLITPQIAGNATPYAMNCYAVPTGSPTISFTGGKYQVWDATFEAVANESGGAEGSWLAQWGKLATTGDVTPPTVSSSTVVDGASGVSKTAGIVMTMSEELDGNTVGPQTGGPQVKSAHIVLANPTGGAGDEIPVTVVLVNNGASTTLTVTPVSAMGGLTAHILYLDSQIKDKAGNVLVGWAINFTTAA